MTLLDRLMQIGDSPFFGAHQFDAILMRRLTDDYTQPRAITELEAHLQSNQDASETPYTLTPTEQNAFNNIKTEHDSLNAASARDFRNEAWARLILLQGGHITRNTYRTEMGITAET